MLKEGAYELQALDSIPGLLPGVGAGVLVQVWEAPRLSEMV